MKNIRWLFLCCGFSLFCTLFGENIATSEPIIQIHGLVQNHLSFQNGNTGEWLAEKDTSLLISFGNYRTRLGIEGQLNLKLSFQFQIAQEYQRSLSVLSAWMDYRIRSYISIKIGKFPSIGPLGGEMTPVEDDEFVYKTSIVRNWNTTFGLDSFHDLGIMMHGSVLNDIFHYKLQLCNGNNKKNVIGNSENGYFYAADAGLSKAGWISVVPVKELSAGTYLYFSNNKQESSSYFDGSSKGIFIRFENPKLKIQSEYIQWNGDYISRDYNWAWAIYTEEKISVDVKGFYLLSSVYITDNLSCGCRYDMYRQSENYRETDITIGVNYCIYLRENIKAAIMTNLVIQSEYLDSPGYSEPENEILVINAQISF